VRLQARYGNNSLSLKSYPVIAKHLSESKEKCGMVNARKEENLTALDTVYTSIH
jgi:hypothetical protein